MELDHLISVLCLFCLLACCSHCTDNLVINIKNKGGEVLQETIEANVTSDTILLDFKNTDGTLITQFVDFKSEVQIFKVLTLGEEELGESQFQVMCFILKFVKNEFISPDAMSKLRQKNPGTIRNPEEEKGHEEHELDVCLDVSKSSVISPHILQQCKGAEEMTFTSESDLKFLSKAGSGKDMNTFLTASRRCQSSKKNLRCKAQTNLLHQPCQCLYDICIGWYPCGLKYCRGKDSAQKTVMYRCGIKTCKKCYSMLYHVRRKLDCLWDE